MWLGTSTPLADAADLRFRVATVKTGCWLTLAVGAFVAFYLVQTWGAGNRAAMLTIVVTVVLFDLVLLALVPFERVVAGRWRESFFFGWSVAVVVVLLVLGLLDPLPRSPLTLPLFMPLLFAGLSYPVRTAVAVSCLVVGGYLAVCIVQGNPLVDGLLVLSSLGWTACMCLWQAHNRKAAESERGRLAAIVESSAEAIMSLTTGGVIQSWNSGAATLYGYTPGEAIGKHAPTLLCSDPAERQRLLASVVVDGRPAQIEGRDVHQDGHALEVSVTDSPILDTEGQIVGIARIAHDIHERKRLEAERERMEVELRISQKLEAVGQLAAGIAHEINTPVQFIGDSAHFLRDAVQDLEQLGERYRELIDAADVVASDELRERARAAEHAADLEYLQERVPVAFARMIDGVDRVASIVRAMKTFGRVSDSEKQDAADINEAIEMTLVVARNEYKYIAEVETVLADLPPVVCNIGDIGQVLLNLIVNAAHAIEDARGESTELGKITIRTEASDGSARVSVSDTGCGIPDELRTRVFDPFFTTKEVGRGTGQGLSLARAIIERHRGTLTFVSEVGRGTTFTVKIPIGGRRDPQSRAAPAAPPAQLPPPDLEAA